MDATERKERLERIRLDRIARNGVVPFDREAAHRAADASMRLVGMWDQLPLPLPIAPTRPNEPSQR